MSNKCLQYLAKEGEIFINEPEEEPDEQAEMYAFVI